MPNPTGWKRKAILLFKSEKRLGANEIFSQFSQKTYQQMKATPLQAGSDFLAMLSQIQTTEAYPTSDLVNDNDTSSYEPKRMRDLYAHFSHLQAEFIGSSELCFYHAILVVLIRRGFKSQTMFAELEKLWQHEQDYLFKALSLRWLVSSADTFIDFSDNPTRQAILLNVPTLINTLKVYETQQDLLTDNHTPNPAKAQAHRQQHLALYDGLRYFRLGTDDTLNNMRQRYEKFATVDKFATEFLLTVFDRLQQPPTAFALLKSLHTDDKSQWW